MVVKTGLEIYAFALVSKSLEMKVEEALRVALHLQAASAA